MILYLDVDMFDEMMVLNKVIVLELDYNEMIKLDSDHDHDLDYLK